jgi:Plasmid pRiA4b ORF-3-like protein
MVGPSHTFAQLAEALDVAFARWDRSHLHVFELPDGRTLGFASDEPEEDDWLDDDALKVTHELRPRDRFSYTFDLGDDWRHRCHVLAEKVDPREEYGPGPLPRTPLAISGWGWIPDQYGRSSQDE